MIKPAHNSTNLVSYRFTSKKIVTTRIANPIYAFMPCLPLFWGHENHRYYLLPL